MSPAVSCERRDSYIWNPDLSRTICKMVRMSRVLFCISQYSNLTPTTPLRVVAVYLNQSLEPFSQYFYQFLLGHGLLLPYISTYIVEAAIKSVAQ